MSCDRDCLTMLLGVSFIGAALTSLLVACEFANQMPKGPVKIAHGCTLPSGCNGDFIHRRPVAITGEWITRPDGRQVCRVTRTIHYYEVLPARGWCDDWKEPAPQVGQTVDGWARRSNGYFQIMVEGEWRP